MPYKEPASFRPRGRKGTGSGMEDPLMPAQKPTKFRPGTKAKLDLLQQRAEAREELWHPEDATFGGGKL